MTTYLDGSETNLSVKKAQEWFRARLGKRLDTTFLTPAEGGARVTETHGRTLSVSRYAPKSAFELDGSEVDVTGKYGKRRISLIDPDTLQITLLDDEDNVWRILTYTESEVQA